MHDSVITAKQIVKTQCVLCVGGCGMNVHLKNGEIIAVDGMKEHPHNEGALCPRGAVAVEYNKSPDRKSPMIKPTKKNRIRLNNTTPPYLIHNALHIHPIKKQNQIFCMA